MFQRVKERVGSRISSSGSSIASTSNNNNNNNNATSTTKRRARRGRRPRPKEQQANNEPGNDDNNDLDDDDMSVQTTITVETTRTAQNENSKFVNPFAAAKPKSTQLFVHAETPVQDLDTAQSDITILSICLKTIPIQQDVASAFLSLIRGDNRSWEAIAVDILRQKARWENITLDDCSGKYLDMIIGFILNLDNCAFLHMSNIVLTKHSAWALQALSFCNSLGKLQLDLIDLRSAIPQLSLGLADNASLKCLITSRCGLGDEHLSVLIASLPKQLEELRIFGNKCRGNGLAEITKVVSSKSSNLKILDLSYQHVQEGDDFDISWMAAALTYNRTLKKLDLDNDSIDDGHMTHLCAMLCDNSTLEELMLNHNKISASGIALLASKFGNMKGLKKISMYSNLFDAPEANNSATSPSTSTPPSQEKVPRERRRSSEQQDVSSTKGAGAGDGDGAGDSSSITTNRGAEATTAGETKTKEVVPAEKQEQDALASSNNEPEEKDEHVLNEENQSGSPVSQGE